MRHAPRYSKGFNLIEAAIVLAVVGLVIGGIWVAAAALEQRRFESKFLEGLLVLSQHAQKYLSQANTCDIGVLSDSSNYPELWETIYPPQWREIGVDARYPHSPYLMCAGDSSSSPTQKYLHLTFWNSTDRYVCNNLMVKILGVCRNTQCFIDTKDWDCGQPDGTNWSMQMPIGR